MFLCQSSSSCVCMSSPGPPPLGASMSSASTEDLACLVSLQTVEETLERRKREEEEEEEKDEDVFPGTNFLAVVDISQVSSEVNRIIENLGLRERKILPFRP